MALGNFECRIVSEAPKERFVARWAHTGSGYLTRVTSNGKFEPDYVELLWR